MNNSSSIGLDLGSTKICGALVSEGGHVSNRTRRTSDAEADAETVVKTLVRAAKRLRIGPEGRHVSGVGVGVGGQIDEESGTVLSAPNFRWRNFPLRSQLEEVLQLPVTVLNDVRAATWGEWLHGAGRDCENLVCISIGMRIGGGVVIRGRMLEGATNSAGELGHLTVDMNGPKCRCHNRGCLEALASGWAIAQQAQEAIAADPTAGAPMLELVNGNVEQVTGKTVSDAYHYGDTLALRIVSDVSRALGAGSVSLVNAFNPERLILGGGVVDGLPHLIEEVKSFVQEHALEAAAKCLEVLPAELKDMAGAIGAAAVAHRARHGIGDEACVLE
jgi:glucokinase